MDGKGNGKGKGKSDGSESYGLRYWAISFW